MNAQTIFYTLMLIGQIALLYQAIEIRHLINKKSDSSHKIYWKDKVIKTIHCDHPKVKRIWEHGGLAQIPTNDLISRTISILLVDNVSVYSFTDDGNSGAEIEAENFLKTL